MAMGDLTPILVLVVLVALVILERYIRNAPKRRYRHAARTTPVCGACAHPAVPRETDRCPECGDTYLHAGIYTQALELRVGPSFVATAISSILGSIVLGFLLMMMVFMLVPWTMMGSTIQNANIQHTQAYTPNRATSPSGATPPTYTLRVVHDGTTNVRGATSASMPTAGTVTLSIDGPNDIGDAAEFDLTAQTWTLTDTSGATVDTGLDFADAAEQLFVRSGLDAAWEGSADELADARAIALSATTSTQPMTLSASPNSFGLDPNATSASFSSGSPNLGAGASLVLGGFVVACLPLLATIISLIVKSVRRNRVLNAQPAHT